MTDSQPPIAPPPPPPGAPAPGPQSKGLVARIFDLSFSEFVTPSIIKIIFVLGIVLAGLSAIAIFVSLAAAGGGGVLVGIIVAPLVFVIYVLIARIVSELYLLLFRIEENTRKS